MVNGTLLNFVKRYDDDLRVIFDQWQKLHLGLDALSNQKILKGIQYLVTKLTYRHRSLGENQKKSQYTNEVKQKGCSLFRIRNGKIYLTGYSFSDDLVIFKILSDIN